MRSFSDMNVSRFIVILPILLTVVGCECPDAIPFAGAPADACIVFEPEPDDRDTSSGGAPTTGAGDCCDQHGSLPGADGICQLGAPEDQTAPMFCVGCDFEPVLCMTHGCVVPNVADCCLSRAGETVPCPG